MFKHCIWLHWVTSDKFDFLYVISLFCLHHILYLASPSLSLIWIFFFFSLSSCTWHRISYIFLWGGWLLRWRPFVNLGCRRIVLRLIRNCLKATANWIDGDALRASRYARRWEPCEACSVKQLTVEYCQLLLFCIFFSFCMISVLLRKWFSLPFINYYYFLQYRRWRIYAGGYVTKLMSEWMP